MLCNAEWVQADAEGGCDVIRKLEQGHCVQYMRDGGWRVGHVVNGLTHGESNVSLVRESQTGELVLVPSWDLQAYPQSPIPEPGVEAVQDDEVWHAADDYPDNRRDVMGDFGGRLVKAWYGVLWHRSPDNKWQWRASGVAPPMTRWRELKEGE